MNRIILASAGAGKTTKVIEEVINSSEIQMLMTTFTDENTEEIKSKFVKTLGYIPNNVKIVPWFTFLLNDLVRPYQKSYHKKRISNMILVSGQSTQYIKKTTKNYYLANEETIYSDKMVEFGLLCNKLTNGMVLNRIKEIYSMIYIDEVQDLAGYDFELIEMLLSKGPEITLIGDLRQATFSTNMSPKYKKFKGKNTLYLFTHWETNGICQIEYMGQSFRSIQEICDFSDSLFEEGLFDKTKSLITSDKNHSGIYYIYNKDLCRYIDKYNPQILRYSVKQTRGFTNEMNFGRSKGLTFDRVLIYPTGPILNYLKTGNNNLKPKSLSALYVAITRARYSVTFVVPDDFKIKLDNIKHYEGGVPE